jgi:tRNA-specific 2-thiouridylase
MASKKRSSEPAGRIAVAMSGGVDSSVAAAILKKNGFDVVGVTFRMWPKEECGSSVGRACCNLEAITRARAAAEKLKIPYYVYDLSDEFRREVIDYFCGAYLGGSTPNPCIICNEKIKFGALWNKARQLGASAIATGHYARVLFDKKSGRSVLLRGRDKTKDQSYFLFSLDQRQLGRAVFPLGQMTKESVRQAAKKAGLASHNVVSSQDVCFVTGADYAEYITKKTGSAIVPGDIVYVDGSVLGRHKGIAFYTIGQRRGIGIAYKEPLYVVSIDAKDNRVVVGTKKDVLKKRLYASGLNWIARVNIDRPVRVMAMIRYNHKPARALVTKLSADEVMVDFDRPQEAPTPGQAVVFYRRDVVLGGGWIN